MKKQEIIKYLQELSKKSYNKGIWTVWEKARVECKAGVLVNYDSYKITLRKLYKIIEKLSTN